MNSRLLLLMLCVVLASCSRAERISPDGGEPVKIDPFSPPNGVHLVQILLENQSFPVKGTGCENKLPDGPDDKRRLQHILAMRFGFGLDNPRLQRVHSGRCKAEQFELRSGSIIDAWRCSLNVVENGEKGEYITNSSIEFGVTKDTWKLITNSVTPNPLICMP